MKKIFYILLLALFPCLSMAQDYEKPDFWKTATVQDIQPLLTAENVNKKLENDATYLMMASNKSANPDVLKAMIKAGYDVNAETKAGITPIMVVNIPSFVDILVKAGAKVNKTASMGFNALAMACKQNDDPEVINELVKAGADIHFKVQGEYNLLMVAAQWNPTLDVIQTLIKSGIDVNERTKSGDTALLLAAMSNPNPKVVETLIKAGADANYHDKDFITPLLIAAARNPNPDMIDVLVKNGADINVIGEPKKKELMFMTRTLSAALAYNSNKEVAKRILANGFDLNNRAPENISSAFTEICPLVDDSQLINDMIKKYGADIKSKTKDKGSSVLMVCSMFSQNPDVIQALIDNGAVVNERTPESWTALMSAARNPNADIIKVLLKNGADTHAMSKSHNTTALMYACGFNSNRDVVIALIDGGSDIRAKDKDGKTAYDRCHQNLQFMYDQDLLNRLK